MNKTKHRIPERMMKAAAALLLFAGCGAPETEDTPEDKESSGVQVRTVKTDTFSMDCIQFGHGEKTLVILPGLSVQSVMIYADSIAEAYGMFADEYTVYVFDRRKELPESYSVHEMAADTAEVLQVLGLKNVNLFGASQGGMIAMVTAMEHPELIQKLILGSTAARMEDERYRAVEEWIRLAEDKEKTKLYLAFGEAIYPADVFEQSKELLKEAAETVSDEDLARFVILAEGMKDFDVTGDLEKITCPVLVIGSMDDHVLGPEASVEIAKHLKRQRGTVLIMYDGYGHAVYDTAPDYRERMAGFLAAESAE